MKVVDKKPDPDAWIVGFKKACYRCWTIVEFDAHDRAQFDWDYSEPNSRYRRLRWKCPSCYAGNTLSETDKPEEHES